MQARRSLTVIGLAACLLLVACGKEAATDEGATLGEASAPSAPSEHAETVALAATESHAPSVSEEELIELRTHALLGDADAVAKLRVLYDENPAVAQMASATPRRSICNIAPTNMTNCVSGANQRHGEPGFDVMAAIDQCTAIYNAEMGQCVNENVYGSQ